MNILYDTIVGFQYNGSKVRKANLAIPRMYSHRIQRIPPVSTDSTCGISNSLGGDRDSNDVDSDRNNTGIDKLLPEVASYYFPVIGSEKWLCIYKK